jgi:hypothetical protein
MFPKIQRLWTNRPAQTRADNDGAHLQQMQGPSVCRQVVSTGQKNRTILPAMRQKVVLAQKGRERNNPVVGSPGEKIPSNKRYFFLNGDLYKTVRIDRHLNLIECFRFIDGVEVVYSWSDVKRDKQRAFRLGAVAKALRIGRDTLMGYIKQGKVTNFQWMYNDRKYKERMFSEDGVLDVWELIMHTHIGRPRADGKITHRTDVPTRGELMAMLKEEDVLYYWDDTSNRFLPVWRPRRLG